jgi:hypothetical protein
MRYLIAGLMVGLLLWGVAQAEEQAMPAAAGAEAGGKQASKYNVSGLPVYDGPMYRSLDSQPVDVTKGEPFHSFHHRGVDEVGYSPLTLDDFRFPVVKRTLQEFNWERERYPKDSKVVWHDDCHHYTVSAFFFTRDMVRDHIQRLIDEYYICDKDIVQQMIDYYAEVTPQCGEAISWVWFSVDDAGHHYADKRENRYFMSYLANFKDKFYLEFGDPKAQKIVDYTDHKFLYQYEKRGPHECGPEFKQSCACGGAGCSSCQQKCSSCGGGGCSKCGGCGTCCPQPWTVPHDKQILCTDLGYKGFTLDPNAHYLYYPRKVVIEDLTYDGVAQAYRWKFAWRFDNCEQDLLRQMCALGFNNRVALVLSEPTWYGYTELNKTLTRDILASVDPQSFGNIWPAGKLPYDMSCCNCPFPVCEGNCQAQPEVGWEAPAVIPDKPIEVIPPTEPPHEEPKEEIPNIPAKG